MSMPAACTHCGELFDMRYDFKKNFEDEIESELENRFVLKNKNGVLCWECRR